MSIILKKHIIQRIRINNKEVSTIFLGKNKIFEAIKSCFGKGYWINEKPWKNDDGWKN